MWWRNVLAVAAVLLSVTSSRAQQVSCGTDRPWVEVVVTHLDTAFKARMLADLRAGLSATRIDTCERGEVVRQRPLATVFVSSGIGEATFSVDVTDSVTQKRIGRDVDLRDVPEDSRAFALAVAAEELLRASWAELSVRRPVDHRVEHPEPTAPAEPAVPPAPPPIENYSVVGLRFAVEHYTEGHTQLGPDAFFGQAVLPWLNLGLCVGARRGLAVDAQHGSISAASLSGELFGEFRLLEGRHYRLDASTGLRGSRAWFSASADADARGSDATGYALFANAGLVLELGARGFLRSQTRAGVGGPLKSLAASDDGRVVTGMSKLVLFASTGVGWEF